MNNGSNTRTAFAAWAGVTAVCIGCQAPRHSAEVQDALYPFVEKGEIAGMVSVLSDADYNLTVDCFGWADAESHVPMTPDTLFACFSMSKCVAGCAVMIAVDRGILRLDDKVSHYLPEFARVENNGITIKDCMTHMTGIAGPYVDYIHRPVPLREMARDLAQTTKFEAKVGEKFLYSNPGVDLAGACLEVAAGMTYDRFVKENIFDPLGMTSTTFDPTPEMRKRLVKAYTADKGHFRPADDRCATMLSLPFGAKIYPSPCAGIFSTPNDFIRFSQMLAHHGEFHGRIIVSRKNFDEIWSKKQTPAHVVKPYTLGSWIYGDWFGHEGAMRTDQRANLKTGHSRLFFIQTENRGGEAFFAAKKAWHEACDRAQNMSIPFAAED